MTLCDTGPLVALVDHSDPHHVDCARALSDLPPTPLVTTWPCLTEAMHLLGRVGGIRAQNTLWALLIDGLVRLHLPSDTEWKRMHSLMNQYADMPLDLADTSLVSAAHELGDHRLFSIDSHLRAVRIDDQQVFDVVP